MTVISNPFSGFMGKTTTQNAIHPSVYTEHIRGGDRKGSNDEYTVDHCERDEVQIIECINRIRFPLTRDLRMI